MDDVFYLSEQQLTLADVASLLRVHGVYVESETENGVVARLGPAPDDGCHWALHSFSEMDPDEAMQLRQDGVLSVFCVSHHPTALQRLLPVLRIVLEAHGGWVGNDDEGYEPRFDFTSLDRFRYPQQ